MLQHTCYFKRKQMNKHSDIENSQNIFKKMKNCFLTESKEFLCFFNSESYLTLELPWSWSDC